MPFLRVIRDKRGYETTYLMHWFHEAGRQRSRILYAFRGPGMARVGREPLEPATMRQLEATHPDIAFDWKAVFADRQVIDAVPEPRRRRPRRDEAEAAPGPEAPPEVKPLVAAAPPPQVRTPTIPSTLQGTTTEERRAFLAQIYPIVRERVERRTTDETRRQALLTLADRLNPSEWGEDGDVTDRFAQAAEALERLARVLTRRRRRSGKGRPLAEAPVDAPREES